MVLRKCKRFWQIIANSQQPTANSQLNSIQIISHGAQGTLYLGNTLLNSENIDNYRSQLSAIGSSLTATGDLLLYGCNVAQGDEGRQFIDRLALFTGADVAASDDSTGNAALGGDWELEGATSTIETASQAIAYSGLLGMTVSPNTKTFQNHTLGEHSNAFAFAALKNDGSVISWGDSLYGGDSSSVASVLNGAIDVKQIYSAGAAFAALRIDGSVVTWGYAPYGGDSLHVASAIDGTIAVSAIYSSLYAFAALRTDGSVVTWGDTLKGGDSSSVASKLDGTIDISKISSNWYSFAALRVDGSVVTWGYNEWGADSSSVASALNGNIDVMNIYSSELAFAALRNDGSVVTWGAASAGGDSSKVTNALDGTIDVTKIASNSLAFAALRADGSVITWGHPGTGGDSSSVADSLNGEIAVTEIESSRLAFAALRADGSVITWGTSYAGGDSSAVAGALDGTIDVKQIFSTHSAFAALRTDGSVVTWGDYTHGGDSSRVASSLDGTIPVVQIYSTYNAFAALRADGSVVSWGSPYSTGGSNSDELNGNIDVIKIYSSGEAFAALRSDGSVVTWGHPGTGGDSSAVANQLSSGVVGLADIYTDDVYTVDTGWQITPNAAVVSEADVKIEFTLTRPNDRIGTAETVYVSTTQNHGSVNSNDYVGLLNLPYDFAVGEASKTVTVDILADSVAELDETFGLIVQTNATDPVSTFLAATTFTIQGGQVIFPDLEGSLWDLDGIDRNGNMFDGDLVFEMQTNTDNVANLSGYFDWVANGTLPFRINFEAELEADGILDFTLTELSTPVNGVIAADYEGIFSADYQTITGSMSGSGIIPGTWSATLIPEPVNSQSASSLELEFFARRVAYGYEPLLKNKGDSVAADANGSNLELFLQGWSVLEVFGADGDTFRAIVLEKQGYNPVLALRGSTNLPDWSENFDPEGVGKLEFDANAEASGLGTWIREQVDNNQKFSITGHSQGGAQAQLATVFASQLGGKVDKLLTFNSPGIPSVSVGELVYSPDIVKHYVNASDIVSVVGESYVPGRPEGPEELAFYDFSVSSVNFSVPFGFETIGGVGGVAFLKSHTNHWSQKEMHELGLGIFTDAPIPRPLSNAPSFTFFSSGDYSPLSDYGQDNEYEDVVFLLAGTFLMAGNIERAKASFSLVDDFLDPSWTSLLSAIGNLADATSIDFERLAFDFLKSYDKRSEMEVFRQEWGWFLQEFISDLGSRGNMVLAGLAGAPAVVIQGVIELGRFLMESTIGVGEITVDFYVALWNTILDGFEFSADVVIGLGDFLIDSTEGALLQTWASANDLASWIGDRFRPDEGVVVVEGTHAGSTPAVILKVQESNNEILSSSASQSTFLLTDPGTTVNIQSGGNIIWGVATDHADTHVTGGVSTTDVHFIQNAFFETDDLDKEKGSAIIHVDLDQDGTNDITITWEGNYRLESIVAEQGVDGTYIRYLGNAVPIAENDDITVLPQGFVTDEDSAFTTANVLANDADGDGDALSVTALDTTGLLGLVTDNGDGTFNYDPNGAFDHLNAGETATDSFAYNVSDGNGGTDTATVTLTIKGAADAPVLNPIIGTNASDYLIGTANADRIHSLSGSYDRSIGGLGADIFVFGSEALNGIRERDVILDYEVGVDSILLKGGASVGSIRSTSTGVTIFLQGDGDAIYVQGVGVHPGNLTFAPENIVIA